jgi:hypothetical protein
VARLQLNERELTALRACLASAIDGTCIPAWEFESLFGCSRGRAKRSLEAGVRRIELRGERPSEPTCERMVLLLSALLGASPGDQDNELLELLIARLGAHDDRAPLRSGISLREDVALLAVKRSGST